MNGFDYIIGIVFCVMDIGGNVFLLEHINATNPTSSTTPY